MTGGDGVGFEGKPDGTYLRYLPEFACEGQSKPYASLVVNGTQVTYEENDPFQCQAQKSELTLADLDISALQTSIMGYKEGIFEHFSETPKEIPAALVEVWCQAPNAPSDFEMIVHYNRSQKSAVAQLITLSTPDTKPRVTSQLAVSRMIQNQNVTIEGSNLSLSVRRDAAFPNRPGEFLGAFKGELDGQSISRSLRCRLGGELDPRLWPLQSVSSLFVKKSAFSASRAESGERRFGFVSPYLMKDSGESSYTESDHLYVFSEKANSHLRLDFAGVAGSTGFGEFRMSPDGRFLYYRSDQEKAHSYALYQYDFATKTNRRLAGAGIDGGGVRAMFRGGFQIFSDGTLVYISDLNSYQPARLAYISGTQPLALPKFIDSPLIAGQLAGFAYSAKHRQLLFVRRATEPGSMDLFSLSVDTGLLQIRLRGYATSTPIVPPDGAEIGDLLTWQKVSQDAVSGLVMKEAISLHLSSGGLLASGPGTTWLTSSRDHSSLLMQTSSGIYLRTPLGQFALPTTFSPNLSVFSEDSRFLWWAAENQGIFGVRSSGETLKPCGFNSSTSVLSLLPKGADQAVALVYRSDLRQTQVLELSGTLETCEVRNRLPMPFEGASSLLSAAVSPSGDALTFTANIELGGALNFMVYRVPLGGEIPVGITASAQPHSGSGQIFFSSDSRRVFLLSTPAGAWTHQIFSWDFLSPLR